jgi:hypothetical protein
MFYYLFILPIQIIVNLSFFLIHQTRHEFDIKIKTLISYKRQTQSVPYLPIKNRSESLKMTLKQIHKQ